MSTLTRSDSSKRWLATWSATRPASGPTSSYRRRRDSCHGVSVPRDLLAQAALLATKEEEPPEAGQPTPSVSAFYYGQAGVDDSLQSWRSLAIMWRT